MISYLTLCVVLHRYDAKYYGYAWADAIACDLATPFRESSDGFLDAKVGKRFRKEILQPGNSRDINESIEKFLGRKWSTDAMFEEMLETTSSNKSRGHFYLYCIVFVMVCVSLSLVSVLILKKKQKQHKEQQNKDPSEEVLAVPLVSYGSTA